MEYYEKIAILSSFTADISFNMFAAEVKTHSDYLVNWISGFKDWIIIGGIVEDKWYSRAIRADMAIGEEYESGYFDDNRRCGKPKIEDGNEKMRMLIQSEKVQKVIGDVIH